MGKTKNKWLCLGMKSTSVFLIGTRNHYKHKNKKESKKHQSDECNKSTVKSRVCD